MGVRVTLTYRAGGGGTLTKINEVTFAMWNDAVSGLISVLVYSSARKGDHWSLESRLEGIKGFVLNLKILFTFLLQSIKPVYNKV